MRYQEFSLMKKVFYFVLVHFVNINHILQSCTESKNVLLFVPSTFITILYMIVAVPVMVFFAIVKSIVYLILKLGRFKFMGFVSGCNMLPDLGMNNGLTSYINIMIEIEADRDFDEMYKIITEHIWKKATSFHRKMFSVQESFLGYTYFKGIDDIKPDEIFKKLSPDSTELSNLLNALYGVGRLPRKNQFNWDMHFVVPPKGNQPDKYLIIFRFNHALVDAISCYQLLHCAFLETKKNNYVMNNENIARLTKIRNAPNLSINNLVFDKHFISSSPGSSESAICGFMSPDTSYINKIKQIKTKYKISFNLILLTAYSASLADFFTKTGKKNPPKYKMLTIAQQMNMNRYKVFEHKSIKKLENDYATVNYKIPIVMEGKENIPVPDYLMERMCLLKDELRMSDASLDDMTSYVCYHTYMKLFPNSLLTSFFKWIRIPTVMATYVFDGTQQICNMQVNNVHIFLQRTCFDIGVFFVSHNGILQFYLYSDASKFSEEELNYIGSKMLKYIEILYDQSINSSHE